MTICRFLKTSVSFAELIFADLRPVNLNFAELRLVNVRPGFTRRFTKKLL